MISIPKTDCKEYNGVLIYLKHDVDTLEKAHAIVGKYAVFMQWVNPSHKITTPDVKHFCIKIQTDFKAFVTWYLEFYPDHKSS